MRFAPAASSAATAGRHAKMRRRLGVSTAGLALNGPLIVTVPMCGWYRRKSPSPCGRANGSRSDSARASVFLTKVAATVCGPALTGARVSIDAAVL
jgi:hypothetical protein